VATQVDGDDGAALRGEVCGEALVDAAVVGQAVDADDRLGGRRSPTPVVEQHGRAP
jgi:hypothetical protein